MIINYLNNSNYFFSNQEKSDNNSVMGNIIYQIIFNLEHIC